jgi:hypothetical protein
VTCVEGLFEIVDLFVVLPQAVLSDPGVFFQVCVCVAWYCTKFDLFGGTVSQCCCLDLLNFRSMGNVYIWIFKDREFWKFQILKFRNVQVVDVSVLC